METNRQIPLWLLIIWSIINTISTFSIPVIVQNQSNDSDYVQLAISILQNKDTDSDLKKWALEIIDKKAPIPLSSNLREKIDSGNVLFPFIPIHDSNGMVIGGVKPTECADGTLVIGGTVLLQNLCAGHGGLKK